MSAQEKLAGLIPGALELELAKEILNDYAHELAEMIRTEIKADSYAYDLGVGDAADLIDPKGGELRWTR